MQIKLKHIIDKQMKTDNISVINLKLSELPEPIERNDNRRDYVSFGTDNLFPQYIIDLYNHSAKMESIITSISEYVYGNGVIISESILSLKDKANKKYDTLEDVICKAIFDYVLFNGFYIQVFRNSEGAITELYNLDFQNCRVSEDESRVVYSDDFANSRSKSVSYDMFDREKFQKCSIFYFKNPKSSNSKYILYLLILEH